MKNKVITSDNQLKIDDQFLIEFYKNKTKVKKSNEIIFINIYFF